MRIPLSMLLQFATMSTAFAADLVELRDVMGKSRTGQLTAFNAKRLTLRLRDGKDFVLPLSQLLRIDRGSRSRGGNRRDAFVYLANGDRLAVAPVKIEGDNLHVVWTGLAKRPTMTLPLISVRAILFQQPAARREFRRLESALMRHRQQHDLLVLRNGDRVTGRLKSLDGSHATMSGSAGKIARANVMAVAFDPRYVETPKSTTERILLRLADGTLVSAKTAVLGSDGSLRIALQSGGDFTLPWTSIVSLQRVGGNVRPLSSLTPTTFEHTPYLDGKRPLQTDRNVLGEPLVLRGREYSLGLGMHSRGEVTYIIPKDATNFLATVGIDDVARGNGAAVFVVQLDGNPVFTSRVLTGKDAAVHVGPIALAGRKKLTLIVEFGPRGDILDYADWCDAVLIQGSKVEESKVESRRVQSLELDHVRSSDLPTFRPSDLPPLRLSTLRLSTFDLETFRLHRSRSRRFLVLGHADRH